MYEDTNYIGNVNDSEMLYYPSASLLHEYLLLVLCLLKSSSRQDPLSTSSLFLTKAVLPLFYTLKLFYKIKPKNIPMGTSGPEAEFQGIYEL
jgi:hypothetical protein